MTINPQISGPDSELAPVWQRRFAFYDRYGQPNSSPQGQAAYRALSFGEKFRLNSNILAFLFAPFYFMVKGMWRKGVTLLAAGFVLGVLLEVFNAPAGFTRIVGFGVSAAAMMTANYAYYLHVRRGSTSWNPFEGFGRPRSV